MPHPIPLLHGQEARMVVTIHPPPSSPSTASHPVLQFTVHPHHPLVPIHMAAPPVPAMLSLLRAHGTLLVCVTASAFTSLLSVVRVTFLIQV